MVMKNLEDEVGKDLFWITVDGFMMPECLQAKGGFEQAGKK